ncbi:MAG: hypothetical protein EH225_05770 [Calditrichaeota bacterium]|nr:hypothetical protein [Calditrichota bacterium]RQV93153.1 MAG: hypothetical protein EH221_10205 [bacterium]RQW04561.1 MAG: hypothetical protein EH225_05770 [Calditrichota bacterium]
MKFYIPVLMVLLAFTLISAQDAVKSDVHLFQTFLQDATISSRGYGDAGIVFADYDYASIFSVGFRGGYPINPQVEVGTALNFINFSPEVGDGESGLSDLTVAGRYQILPDNTKLAVGGYLTLPIGKEEIGQGNLDFGAFGAIRHPLQNGMVITGVLGLNFIETTTQTFNQQTFEVEKETDYETSILIGGGAIYPINEQFHVIGELNFQTEGDYALLTGGVDYTLAMGSKIRGALGFGLDDGAPDLMLMGSFLFFLR